MVNQKENRSQLSISDMDELLRYWEHQISGYRWSDEERTDVIEYVMSVDWTLEEWKNHLIKIPDQLYSRYRKVLKMCFDDGLLDQKEHDYEVEVMKKYSLAELTRSGKHYNELHRQRTPRFGC